MAKKLAKPSKTKTPKKKIISQTTIEPYEHRDKQRLNKAPVSLVNADAEREGSRKTNELDLDSPPQSFG